MKYNVLHNFISPISGRITCNTNYVPFGNRQNIAVPSPILLDMRLDILKLRADIDNIISFPADVGFVITVASPLIPNAQVLENIGVGITKLNVGGIFAIATQNVDYITLSYLESNYVSIINFPVYFASEFPSAFLAAYTPAITASLATYTTTVLTPAVSAGVATAIATSAAAINALQVNLTGVVTASGLLNTTVTTSFSPDPIFPGTGSATIPVGTTAQRSGTPTFGMIRANTDFYHYECRNINGIDWDPFITKIRGVSNQIAISGTPSEPSLGLVDDLYLFGTGYVKIPAGTTAQRGIDTYLGMMRLNTDSMNVEYYNNNGWSTMGSGNVTSVGINSSSSGLNITGSPITSSGTITLTLGTDLQALASMGATGMLVRSGSGAFTARSIAVGSSNLTITNGSGVSGNPTINLSTTLSSLTSIGVGNLSLSGNILSSTNTNGAIILSPNGTGEIQANKNINIQSQGILKLYNSANTFYVGLKAANPAANVTWILPAADSSGFFKSDGAGNISIGSAVTSITAGTGLSGGTITSTGTIALANTAVSAGTYNFATLTVDAQGRLTSASTGVPVTSIAITGSTGLTVGGSPITSSGTITLTLGSELQGLSGVSGTGLIVRSGGGPFLSRTITAGSGISVTNGNGVSGEPTIAVNNIPINTLSGYPSASNYFLRGDGSWSDTLTGNFSVNGMVTITGASGTITAFAYFKKEGSSAASGYWSLTGLSLALKCTTGSVAAVEFEATSSIKKKNILMNLNDSKEELRRKFDNINFVKYEWRDKQQEGFGEYYGYIAENIAEEFPELVNLEHMEYSPSILKFADIKNVELKIYDIFFKEDVDIPVLSKIKILIFINDKEEQREVLVLRKINFSTYRISTGEDIPVNHNIFVYGIYESVPLVSKTRFHDMTAARLKILIDEVSILSEKINTMENKFAEKPTF